jgi:hypothetical protein
MTYLKILKTVNIILYIIVTLGIVGNISSSIQLGNDFTTVKNYVSITIIFTIIFGIFCFICRFSNTKYFVISLNLFLFFLLVILKIIGWFVVLIVFEGKVSISFFDLESSMHIFLGLLLLVCALIIIKLDTEEEERRGDTDQ